MLTGELFVDSAVFRQQAVKLAVRGDHAAFGQICIQAQAAHGAEQTSDGNFLLAVCLRADGEHAPAVFAVGLLLVAGVDVHVWTKSDDHIFSSGSER